MWKERMSGKANQDLSEKFWNNYIIVLRQNDDIKYVASINGFMIGNQGGICYEYEQYRSVCK